MKNPQEPHIHPMAAPWAILFDSTLCIGCRSCEAACNASWGLPYDEDIAAQERLSARKLTTVVSRGESYARRLCMHCLAPTCGSVCPVGALQKSPVGPVTYDESRCIGCRYCMLACPFQVPAYEWDRRLPRVRKCDMCAGRLSRGNVTACSEACPTGATITGNRQQIVKEARRRIATNPDRYNGRIYGLTEVGGTSVLLLSKLPLEQFGYRTDLPPEELPNRTQKALAFVPDVVGVGAVLLGGIYWITHRREEVAAAESRKANTRRGQSG